MPRIGTKHKRLIYAFEFSDKSVYVGLTYNSNIRRLKHLCDKISQVYKHILSSGLYPKFNELTDYLDVNVAAIKEGEFLEKYRSEGWRVLNKAKTGALGGSSIKWTFEKCKEDAMKYKTKSEWMINSPSAYTLSNKHKWAALCTKHMIPYKKGI